MLLFNFFGYNNYCHHNYIPQSSLLLSLLSYSLICTLEFFSHYHIRVYPETVSYHDCVTVTPSLSLLPDTQLPLQKSTICNCVIDYDGNLIHIQSGSTEQGRATHLALASALVQRNWVLENSRTFWQVMSINWTAYCTFTVSARTTLEMWIGLTGNLLQEGSKNIGNIGIIANTR